MSAEFNLRQLIREELATSPVADPRIVAEHVLKQVPDDHLRGALGYCLPQIVRSMVSGRLPAVRHVPAKRSRSAKCQDQAWYRGLLRKRIEVGDDGRDWKFLGECTRDDVLRAAVFRREQAAANVAVAEQLERLAEKMRVYRKKTVDKLDAGLLAEVFG